MIKEDLGKFIEEYTQLETEKRTLAEDMKNLFDEYKEKTDIKALKAAIRIAKVMSKMDKSERDEMETLLETLDGKV